MKESDLSIIIISFNTRELLRNCINSVYETTKNLNYEIIIVDNASTDGSHEMIEKEFKEITLIRNRKNLFFAKANNQAMRIAKGKYYLLINSDTIIKEGAIETLVKFMGEHPKAAAVGSKVLNPNGTLQSKGHYYPSILIVLIRLVGVNKFLSQRIRNYLFPKSYWDENELRKVDWVSGCCILIRRSVAEKIGLLSEEFLMYYEDVEWCYRAKKNKYEIWYNPNASIMHYGGASQLKNKEEIAGLSIKLFYTKTIGLYRGIFISWLKILSLFISWFISLIKFSGKEEREAIIYNLKTEVKQFKVLLE